MTRSWFSSLFCTALPAETAVRIWDVLFLEGPKILFRVALALFKVWLDTQLASNLTCLSSKEVSLHLTGLTNAKSSGSVRVGCA